MHLIQMEKISKKNYCNKKIRVTKNNISFEATIIDTCSDKDCRGCCTKNSRNGFLVDAEWYTVLRELKKTSEADGIVSW